MRFRIQSPKQIERTARKQKEPDGQGTHASPKREKKRKQSHSKWHSALHQRRFCAYSVSASRRLLLIAQLALRLLHFHLSFARPIISDYKFL